MNKKLKKIFSTIENRLPTFYVDSINQNKKKKNIFTKKLCENILNINYNIASSNIIINRSKLYKSLLELRCKIYTLKNKKVIKLVLKTYDKFLKLIPVSLKNDTSKEVSYHLSSYYLDKWYDALGNDIWEAHSIENNKYIFEKRYIKEWDLYQFTIWIDIGSNQKAITFECGSKVFQKLDEKFLKDNENFIIWSFLSWASKIKINSCYQDWIFIIEK